MWISGESRHPLPSSDAGFTCIKKSTVQRLYQSSLLQDHLFRAININRRFMIYIDYSTDQRSCKIILILTYLQSKLGLTGKTHPEGSDSSLHPLVLDILTTPLRRPQVFSYLLPYVTSGSRLYQLLLFLLLITRQTEHLTGPTTEAPIRVLIHVVRALECY